MAQILHATLNHANLNLGIPAESHQPAVGITVAVLFVSIGGWGQLAGAAEVLALPDTGNLVDYRGQNGAVGTFQVTGATDGRVIGTRIYTDDSDVPTAAVHAGVVQPRETRNLSIKILGGKASYQGSSSRGIVSESYGRWLGSFEFLDPPEVQDTSKVLPDPGTLKGYRDQVGNTLKFDVTGKIQGVIYGDGTFTDDSDLATAAVFAGVLAPGERAVVDVTILPGQGHYVSARRNNITSFEFGEWGETSDLPALRPLLTISLSIPAIWKAFADEMDRCSSSPLSVRSAGQSMVMASIPTTHTSPERRSTPDCLQMASQALSPFRFFRVRANILAPHGMA
jgi:hypothetical protein